MGQFIREQRHLGHLSLRKLSEMAGVSNPYLSQIERGLRNPSAEILQQIARALRISAESLYVKAGILDPRDEPVSLVDHILGAPELSDDQKHTLVRVYRSFCLENAPDQPAPEPEPEPEPELEAELEPEPERAGPSAESPPAGGR
ncbi:MAG: helix-turn-helix transcriptional regulator [Acidimicrobiales bacterium]|nr:helix-turn-helix transcriptional regulator [Acidimicrobiales bacterium]